MELDAGIGELLAASATGLAGDTEVSVSSAAQMLSVDS